MNAGILRERVTIQSEQRTSNGRGGFTTGWSNVTAPTVAAEIVGLSGDEAIEANIQRASTTWRVTIRRRSDVTPKHRLLWGAVVMAVRSVIPHPKWPREATLLICESGASIDGS